VSIICGPTILPLETRGMLVDPCFPLYAMMTNVNSCSLRNPTTARWSLESSFLQSRRRQEKERLEAYPATEERAIDARTMQRDKALEERGGSTYDIFCRMNQVGITGLDYYFG
jgi:hypothetical protein